jgi:radical SAM superfamily enzyme YgiQ (UPF0313 family)
MKILLIYPLDRDFMPPSMPPLGLAYVASALMDNGHEITVIDLNGDREHGLSDLQYLLQSKSYDMIGISSIITQYKRVKELGKLIKSIVPDTPLIMGGSGPTSIPEFYLKNCSADIVCIGEGEATVNELAFLIQNKIPLESCKGIIFKNGSGQYFTTAPREHISDINKIKFPAWELFNSINTYMGNYLFRSGRKTGVSILSTRGCPGQCNYCMCNFGRRLRARYPENIFSEINILVKKYNMEHIHFVDDTFITTPQRVKDICHMFKDSFKNVTWSANVRADLVTADILKNIAEANCISLAYGIESGSRTVLEYIRKGITPEQAGNAIKWTREAEILLTTYFMLGMPCETPDTVRETINFCKDNLVGGEFFFVTPFPKTELYQYALDNRIITNEDIYLEHAGEVRNFVVNLTKMSNEELFDLKEAAETEIRQHLKKHNIIVKSSIRENPRETVKNLPKF